ncbi:branched-chain-amino-acid aminotransferase 2, chloroplastic-like [Amaranthus tricolor]|uniref:branched-chain-amino-acid aminotransferase 2, chloroplastic-like n=1 Tax=Amaranthus tricolor TaxID=29722 RepID=UPI00258864C7|nr:branched-chain-amino-acid aminotransferase 2, chloroplastic-like [Amaranthus tricolor]
MAPTSSSFSSSHTNGEHGYAEIDWDSLGFGLTPTDYMYMLKCSKNEEFTNGKLIPYGNIELSPAAAVLNYGQGIFEGLKATRRKDGKMVLFRPNENALRMIKGAERMCMPSPTVEHFIDAAKQTARANKRWIPPPGKGSLYLRPLLIGTGPILGLAPAPEYTFLIYASPVRAYFKEGGTALNLVVENEFDRASRGGVGGVKSITNYAPVLNAMTRAKKKGFSDVIYLDSITGKYIEEVSTCNIFMVKDKIISTPPTKGTILPGVTRKSIIEIAREYYGFKVEERQIEIEELMKADEAFCTGTAVAVVPIGSITYQDTRVEYQTTDNNDSVCKKLCSTYAAIQNGEIEDKKGWIVEIN